LQFVLRDTTTVIAHADQTRTALLNIDFDARSTGIKAVFNQLFDHGRWPFDHFAGSNLVDKFGRKGADDWHR
jgi:hypothetical protein